MLLYEVLRHCKSEELMCIENFTQQDFDDDEIPEEIINAWANCSVPDCPNKVCVWLGSGMCYPHAIYGRLVPVNQIIRDREAGRVP